MSLRMVPLSCFERAPDWRRAREPEGLQGVVLYLMLLLRWRSLYLILYKKQKAAVLRIINSLLSLPSDKLYSAHQLHCPPPPDSFMHAIHGTYLSIFKNLHNAMRLGHSLLIYLLTNEGFYKP